MSQVDLLCVTCLSNPIDGIAMPSEIVEFLLNIFRFKFSMRIDFPRLCLSCYRTLCEIKRFYVQLQDVEHYFKKEVVKGLKERPSYTPASTKMLHASRKCSNRPAIKFEKPKSSNIKICTIETLNDEKVYNQQLPEINSNMKTIEELYEKVIASPKTENALLTLNAEGIPSKCDKCYRIFDVAEAYKKHMQWHSSHRTAYGKSTKERKFACKTCGKRFSTSFEKKSHEITHTDLRPYKCDTCPKTFRQLSGLSVHRAVHSGKRVECPKCGKRFSTKFEMFKHIKVHRKRSEDYLCTSGTETFSQHDEVHEHKLTHSERFTCGVCDKMYCNEETLQAHVSITHHMEDDETVIPPESTELRKSTVDRSHLETEENLFIEAVTEAILRE